MKFYFTCLFVFLNSFSFACDKCLEQIEIRIEVMQYYLDHTEVEQYKQYQKGAIDGLKMSAFIYSLNHEPSCLN